LKQVMCTLVKIIEAEPTGKKDFVHKSGMQLWPVLECYPSICGKSGKNKKNHHECAQSLAWDLNMVHPLTGIGVLTTKLQCYVLMGQDVLSVTVTYFCAIMSSYVWTWYATNVQLLDRNHYLPMNSFTRSNVTADVFH
jgi:hypothetical protein